MPSVRRAFLLTAVLVAFCTLPTVFAQGTQILYLNSFSGDVWPAHCGDLLCFATDVHGEAAGDDEYLGEQDLQERLEEPDAVDSRDDIQLRGSEQARSASDDQAQGQCLLAPYCRLPCTPARASTILCACSAPSLIMMTSPPCRRVHAGACTEVTKLPFHCRMLCLYDHDLRLICRRGTRCSRYRF